MTEKQSTIRAKPRQSVARIYLIRGKKVVLAKDLAALYGIRTAALTQTVTRSVDRFPENLSFQLTRKELDAVMSQTATWRDGRVCGGKMPWVFTELGVVMLSIVMHNEKARQVNRMIEWHAEAN